MSIFGEALKFKRKYPMTIAWRLRKNSAIVEKHLNPDEEVLYTFVAQKNNSPLDIFQTAVIVLTNKRILIGRKRVVFGYFFDAVTPDMFNDLNVVGGVIWGKICIDTIKEQIYLSNISKSALPEIETTVSSYMMEARKLYINSDKDKKAS